MSNKNAAFQNYSHQCPNNLRMKQRSRRLRIDSWRPPGVGPTRSRRCQNKRERTHNHTAPGVSDAESINNNGYSVNEQDSRPQRQPYARGSGSPSQIIHRIMPKTLTRTFPFRIFSHPSCAEVRTQRLIGTCTQMLIISRTSQLFIVSMQSAPSNSNESMNPMGY